MRELMVRPELGGDESRLVADAGHRGVGKLPPRCADSIVQTDFDEECDAGPNTGKDGTCSKACKTIIYLPPWQICLPVRGQAPASGRPSSTTAMPPEPSAQPHQTLVSATPDEERVNAATHLLGAALALAGTAVLLALAVKRGDPWRTASFGLYGAALVAQYVSSFLYHSARGPAKPLLRNIDHCAIYLLIAGTYTPFTLVTLRGNWGWPLFIAIWSLATLGLVQEIWFTKRSRFLSLAIYLLMGWLALLAFVPLVSILTYRGFAWIAAGGLLYTGGIYFYAASKRGMRNGHGIWHLFVLGGSACHYLAVLLFVA